MPIASRRVTVTDAATLLTSEVGQEGRGQSVLFRNAGAASVDVGGAGVTTGAGFELAAGASLVLDTYGEAVYGIAAAAGSVRVDVLEVGV